MSADITHSVMVHFIEHRLPVSVSAETLTPRRSGDTDNQTWSVHLGSDLTLFLTARQARRLANDLADACLDLPFCDIEDDDFPAFRPGP